MQTIRKQKRISDQDQAVADYLESISVTFGAFYNGHEVSEEWDSDTWSATIKSARDEHRFSYRTGIGLRTNAKGQTAPFQRAKTLYELQKRERDYLPTIPTAASVIHALLMDSQCGQLSHYDFCEEYGYDYDSIKALGIYRECEKTARQMRELFTNEQLDKLNQLLEEY